MKPNELFNHIWNTQYNKSGFDLDWKVELDGADKKVRLLFQPSMSIKDWIINIAGFLPIYNFPIFYCWGWKKVFDGCDWIILNEVLEACKSNPDYKLEITGHSYGGAMSIIAAIEVYKKLKIKADVITFGSPKPLFLFISKIIAKNMLGNVIQYAHRSDCVTYMPPFIGYHNVKVKRLGKFKIKDFFNPNVYHMIYGDENLYNEV